MYGATYKTGPIIIGLSNKLDKGKTPEDILGGFVMLITQ